MPELAGLSVTGVSVGGIETCIEVPQWKLAFDIGRCPPSALLRPTVLFTHAHMDHMGGVAMHAATRSLRGMRPPTYVVPRENEAAFGDLLSVWRRLDGSELPCTSVFLGPGEEHPLRDDLVARPFRSIHRAPCQGYGIWSQRQKLRPEYRGLAAAEIRRRRLEGAAVTRTIDVCELAFTGDTRIEVIERQAFLQTARRLVIEVTFVDERVSVEECRAKGHVHLFELAERAELFRNEALLFTHFSARYRPDEVLRALDERLPPELRARVQALLPERAAQAS